MYDCQGVLVNTISGEGITQWHVDKHMPAGVYFVEVYTAGDTFRQKVIKLK
jgi:hypothetical protein